MDFEKEINLLIEKGDNEPLLKTLDTYLVKAYNKGWNDCLLGDDAPAIDAQTERDILLQIKTEPPKRSRTTKWERMDEYSPTIIKSATTQDLYQKAIRFAGEKHYQQTLPGSKANYLVHISNVAMEVLLAYEADQNFDVNFAIQVALLHDTIEDTDATYDELAQTFDNRIAKAVQALSKDSTILSKELRMEDSLSRIFTLEKEVGLVKLADRITNLQPPPEHWTKVKVEQYEREAQKIVNNLGYCNNYLAIRLQEKIQQAQND